MYWTGTSLIILLLTRKTLPTTHVIRRIEGAFALHTCFARMNVSLITFLPYLRYFVMSRDSYELHILLAHLLNTKLQYLRQSNLTIHS